MLISDNNPKFIFIAIPKTGTHSVRSIFKEYSTDEHIGNGGGLSMPHKSKFEEFRKIHHGHLTILQMKEVVSLKDYFTFCVFRNPYSRAISIWSFLNRNNPIKPNIVEFLTNNQNKLLCKPQSYFITNEANEILVDHIILFEDYQRGINEVLEHLGIENQQLPKLNSSKHDNYQKYYDQNPELKKIVETIYQKDIQIWNKLVNHS